MASRENVEQDAIDANVYYRRILQKINDELVSDNISAMKFLCQDFIPGARREQVCRGIDLFDILQTKRLLGNNNTALLVKLLQTIARNDLTKLLEPSTGTSAEFLSSFRVILFKVWRELTKENVNSMKFMCEGLLNRSLPDVKTCGHLFTTLEESGHLSAVKIKVILDLLQVIGREDLHELFTPLQQPQGSYSQFHHAHVSQTMLKQTHSEFQHFRISEETVGELVAPSTGHDAETAELMAPSAGHTAESVESTSHSTGHAAESVELMSRSTGHAAESVESVAPSPCHAAESVESVAPSLRHAAEPVEPVSPSSGQHLQPTVSSNKSPDCCDASADPQGSSHSQSGIGLVNSAGNAATQNSGSHDHLAYISETAHDQDFELQRSGIAEGHVGELMVPSAGPSEPIVSHSGSEDCYDMSANPRGICLIIDIESFRDNEERTGTKVDCDKLKKLFQKLHFEVSVKRNKTASEILDLMNQYSSKDHTSFSCFICCILTHGMLDKIYGSDSATVNTRDLTSSFKASKCRSLVGKPKLFFLQACQSIPEKKSGSGVKKDCLSAMIPEMADFLFGFATPPGCVAYRCEINGTWYINKLVEMLEKYHQSEHLLDILTRVNKEVCNIVGQTEDGDVCKQVPWPTYSLTKKVFFH